MSPTAQDVTLEAARSAGVCLNNCRTVIGHCLGQLKEEQVWWRPHERMNSVGNLLLHLAGNLRQWIVLGIPGGEDLRNRPGEFSRQGGVSKAELMVQLKRTIDEALEVLRSADAGQLIRERKIQGFAVTGWGAIFDSIPHFKGHTQEIVCLTRLQLGDDYQFQWEPQNPEQGADSVV